MLRHLPFKIQERISCWRFPEVDLRGKRNIGQGFQLKSEEISRSHKFHTLPCQRHQTDAMRESSWDHRTVWTAWWSDLKFWRNILEMMNRVGLPWSKQKKPYSRAEGKHSLYTESMLDQERQDCRRHRRGISCLALSCFNSGSPFGCASCDELPLDFGQPVKVRMINDSQVWRCKSSVLNARGQSVVALVMKRGGGVALCHQIFPTRVGVHRKFICYPNLFGKSQTQNARQKFGFWIGDFGILGRVPGELPLGDFATVGRAQQQPQQPP